MTNSDRELCTHCDTMQELPCSSSAVLPHKRCEHYQAKLRSDQGYSPIPTATPVEETKTDREWREQDAAHDFTVSLEDKSDYRLNGLPLWHREFLRQAFHAGAKWAREQLLPGNREMKITSSNVVVDPNYHWQPMATCPVKSKVQLIGAGGLPTYGEWDGKNKFYVGWQKIPTRAPE